MKRRHLRQKISKHKMCQKHKQKFPNFKILYLNTSFTELEANRSQNT